MERSICCPCCIDCQTRLFIVDSVEADMTALRISTLLSLTIMSLPWAFADEAIYDEAKLPSFTLPDPLVFADGQPVRSAQDWSRRRAEILDLFQQYVYGVVPVSQIRFRARTDSVEPDALDGKAVRKLVTLTASGNRRERQIELLIYLPKRTAGSQPIPAFVGLNFNGNHTVQPDPEIPLTKSWVRNGDGIRDNRATAEMRGKQAGRWPIDRIVDRGYGVVTAYYGDIDPDFDDGFQNGVHALFPDDANIDQGSKWGSIATWAWGLSRIMDYIESDDAFDSSRIAVMGHSRLGKTSLWAGASDERFAMVVSNNSGCGGAALSRRRYGESVKRINTSFPHWFCDNFTKYNHNEDACPVDQHMLIALIGPRPVLICSAEEDRWADPHGELLSGLHASPVYQLLHADGMAASTMPNLNEPIMSRIGYHIRPGRHDVLPEDWDVYMDFADKHMQ